MKAVLFDRFGPASEVLQIKDVPIPPVGPGQVRVRMKMFPINPSDLMTIQGTYGKLPALPATPGFEGVGVVDEVGSGLLAKIRGLKPGRRVAVLSSLTGNWAEYAVLNARQAVPVPEDLPDDQVATYFVNPATAIVMLRYVLKVPRGSWLLQTAAGSALGRMVIRMGNYCGFRTINVVRRKEQAEELKKLGADEVIATQVEKVEDRVKAITSGEGVPFALDCVGGETGWDAAKSLGYRGILLLYGTLSEAPIPVHPRWLMFGEKRIQGFWLSEWVKDQNVLTMLNIFRQINHLMKAGILTSVVQATFPIEKIQDAVRLAETSGRTGKNISINGVAWDR